MGIKNYGIEFLNECGELVSLTNNKNDAEVETKLLKHYFGNVKKVELAMLDFTKEHVMDGIFIARYKDEYVLTDINAGEVYKFSTNYKLCQDDFGFLAIEKNGIVTSIVEAPYIDGVFKVRVVDGVLKTNYTKCSCGPSNPDGYPAVRFSNHYNKSLRVHWVVILMKYGIELVEWCIGDKDERVYDIHHRVSYKISKDNSIHNLEVLPSAVHNALHGR